MKTGLVLRIDLVNEFTYSLDKLHNAVMSAVRRADYDGYQVMSIDIKPFYARVLFVFTKKTEVVNLRNEPYDVYIGRPSKWGNPYKIRVGQSREQAIALYRDYVRLTPGLRNALSELKGKRLGCFCKPSPCHGDVLVELIKELEI